MNNIPKLNQKEDYTSSWKKNGERYGVSYVDFTKMMDYFNLSKLPDYENMAEPYISYIFMSRPSLNIVGTSDPWRTNKESDRFAAGNLKAMQTNTMTSAFTNDYYGVRMLRALSDNADNAWLPVVTNKAMSYSVGDMDLKTIDKGNTFFGHMIKYGKHSEDHKVAGSISIDFRNDRYLSIFKMVQLWMQYIYIISKTGAITPSVINQKNGILDYAGSLYYLVTRRDGRELVYWEKLVGVFPTHLPYSIFSSNDDMILSDKFSIDFSYGIRKDPCDPNILMDINVLSGDYYSDIETKFKTGAAHDRSGKPSTLKNEVNIHNSYEAPFVKGDIYATNPYITMAKVDGSIKYYLAFEKRR